MNEREKENCLSYWLPILKASDVKTPETIIEEVDNSVLEIFDGKKSALFDNLVSRLQSAGDKIGYPCFLRSGHTSHKHGWERSCFVVDRNKMGNHVADIMEFACCCDMIGLPYNIWAIREPLPLKTSFTAFYGNMPINKERRYFINDGKVICHHPYWPKHAFGGWEHSIRPVENWRDELVKLNRESKDEIKLLSVLSERVASNFKGYWSLDWAQTQNGEWYAIDMAIGERSYHWLDCTKKIT